MWKLIFNGLISELSQKQHDIWIVTQNKTQQSNIIIALLTPPSFVSSLTYWTSSLLSWICKHVDYVQSLLFLSEIASSKATCQVALHTVVNCPLLYNQTEINRLYLHHEGVETLVQLLHCLPLYFKRQKPSLSKNLTVGPATKIEVNELWIRYSFSSSSKQQFLKRLCINVLVIHIW